MISPELFELILLILFIAPIVLFLFFVIISFVIRDNPKINKIKKEVERILFNIPVLLPLLFPFFVIRSLVSFVTRYYAKKKII